MEPGGQGGQCPQPRPLGGASSMLSGQAALLALPQLGPEMQRLEKRQAAPCWSQVSPQVRSPGSRPPGPALVCMPPDPPTPMPHHSPHSHKPLQQPSQAPWGPAGS